MKYFTRAWTRGDSDEATASASRRYLRRLRSIWCRLPRSVQKLARKISIHDGRPRGGFHDSATGILELRLIGGDLQEGYFDLVLRYHAAEVLSPGGHTLFDLMNDTDTEFHYDEVDLRRDSRLEHRILFFPRGEVSIRFRRLDLVRSPLRLPKNWRRSPRFVARPRFRRSERRTS